MARTAWFAGAGLGAVFAASFGVACNFENGTPGNPEAGAPDVIFTVPDAGGIDGAADAPPGDATSEATVDASPDAPGDAPAEAACVPAGTPVMHTADITADETWASGIHLVPSSLQIKGGARVTVAACSEVRLGAGASITVTAGAAGFDAVGTSSAPITFVADQAGARWGALDVTAPATSHLAYVTLTGGGTGPHDAAPAAGATLAAHGSDPQRPVVFHLEQVTLNGSGGLGVFLRGARLDPASAGLTITGSGWYPLYTGVGSVSELPSGSYTGNAIDQILLQTYQVAAYDDTAALLSDVTMHDLGVPYRVGTVSSSIRIGDGLAASPPASLTIEAGVTLLFSPQGTGGTSELLVSSQPAGSGYQPQGALVVQGTATAPVTFDSAAGSPAPGDWLGLYFTHVLAPKTSIQHARILHAGGTSGAVGVCGSTPSANNGVATCALIALLDAPPPASFLASSHIEAAPCGVYRGWSQTDVDFTSGNEFVSVPGCVQTSIPSASGACMACTAGP